MPNCRRPRVRPRPWTGGNAEHGRQAVRIYGCGACHRVAGISEGGKVGPPLQHFQQKSLVAGSLPNSVGMLVHPTWLRPGTAMPETGIGEATARDVAAYLSLRPINSGGDSVLGTHRKPHRGAEQGSFRPSPSRRPLASPIAR
jgi:cytochrome c2